MMNSLIDYGNPRRPMILEDYEAYENACRLLGREPMERQFKEDRVPGDPGETEIFIKNEYDRGNSVKRVYHEGGRDAGGFWCIEWEKPTEHHEGVIWRTPTLSEPYWKGCIAVVNQIVRRCERARRQIPEDIRISRKIREILER